jgi:hypothetical protein
MALIVVIGTFTFGASLNSLISHPALYGWNWGYELNTPEGGDYIPEHQAAQLLEHDPLVAAWTGVYFDSLRVGGLTIPIIGETPGASVGPPLLSGHILEAPNQILLGASTLDELHKRVGDTVEASYGTIAEPTVLRIVGTATMPAVGPVLGLHLSMGTAALVSDLLIPANVRRPSSGPAGPNAIFVRLRARARQRRSTHFSGLKPYWMPIQMLHQCQCCRLSGRQTSSTAARWGRRRSSLAPDWLSVPSSPSD